MPAGIGALVAQAVYIGISALTAIGVSTATATAVFNIGITLAGLALLGKISKTLLPDTPDLSSSAGAKQATIRSTVEYRRIIYGQTLVSGPVVYQNTAGTHNDLMFGLVAVAGHEIEDITDVWLDDVEIVEADIDWAGDGSVDDGPYRGDTGRDPVVFFEKGLGTSTQASSSFLSTYFTEWGANHRGRGVAWLCFRLDYIKHQEKVFERGAPQNYKALVKGKKIYDPRLDSTQSGGSGSQRVDDESTWTWSENPILCVADYIRDSRVGMQEDYSRIDWDLVMTEADKCEVTVSTPSGTQDRFTCNGVLDTGASHRTNIDGLLSSCNGNLTFTGGKWRVRAWGYSTPTIEITEEDLRDDLSLRVNSPLGERYNTVRGVYIDPDRQYKASEMIEVTTASYQARDGNQKLYSDIQFPFTNDEFMAQRLALGVLDMSDRQEVLTLPSKLTTLQVPIAENVQVTLDELSYNQRVFRCTGYKWGGDGVDLVLREDDSALYTDPATGDYATRTNAGAVTFPSMKVPMPTSFYVINQVGGIQLKWTAPPHRLYDQTEVWRNDVQSLDNASLLSEVRGESYLDSEIDTQRYWYWIRGRNYNDDVSTFVPLTGVEGVMVPDDFLNRDPGFEMTLLGYEDTRHWRGLGSGAVTGRNAIIKSGEGHGGSHYLQLSMAANSGFISGLPVYNQKHSPLARGLELDWWIRYRVTTYTTVATADINLWFQGKRNVRDNDSALLKSNITYITNSIGWTEASGSVPVNSLSNVNSYSLISANLQLNVFANVGTGHINVDIDEVFMRYKNP